MSERWKKINGWISTREDGSYVLRIRDDKLRGWHERVIAPKGTTFIPDPEWNDQGPVKFLEEES